MHPGPWLLLAWSRVLAVADAKDWTCPEFWEGKFARNRERDVRLEGTAAEASWTTLTIWECETRDSAALVDRLVTCLGKCRQA
jgi:G:T-mismatch repair DNA endonuclease (very short patch repair protein)